MKFTSGEIVVIWPSNYLAPIFGIVVKRLQKDVYEVFADEKLWSIHCDFISRDESTVRRIPYDIADIMAQQIAEEIDKQILDDLIAAAEHQSK